MSLTEAERQRIEQEEMVRAEARLRAETELKRKLDQPAVDSGIDKGCGPRPDRRGPELLPYFGEEAVLGDKQPPRRATL
jgi:hypothetical protein